jgi:hypothetical protein
MSSISTVHTLVPFDSAKSKPLSDQRLIKVLFKSASELPSVCASVPFVPVLSAEQLQTLEPFVRSMIQDTQDKIAKQKYLNGATVLSDSDLSLESCIEFLEDSNEGGRLTKESIGLWFETNLTEKLIVAFAEKLGLSDTPTPAEESKLFESVAAYKEKVSSLAGGKTVFAPALASKIKSVLELAPASDILRNRFIAGMDKMSETQQDLLLSL